MTDDTLNRTLAFARRVASLVRPLLTVPLTEDAARQLTRASAAAASYHRAACGTRSPAEITSRLAMCIEASDESVFWLEYLHKTGLSADPDLLTLAVEGRELTRTFSEIARDRAAAHTRPKRDPPARRRRA
jgi:four helix bundle protein